MTAALWVATLNSSSPRYQDWLQILGNDAVPLDSPCQITATLGCEREEVYMLAIHQLTANQRLHLICWVASKFNANPEEIRKEIEQQGFPIRTSDVIVTFSTRAFI
jgi:hypothetical protein